MGSGIYFLILNFCCFIFLSSLFFSFSITPYLPKTLYANALS